MTDAKRTKITKLRRTMLDEVLINGVPTPEEFEPDVLLRGQAHQIYTGPGDGKTWVALWLIAQAIQRGQPVAYFDMENGRRIVTERLQDLGISAADKYLHYFDYPALDMSSQAKEEYISLLDDVAPELVVFDSWIGFLAAGALDENSPTHIELWANAYLHPAQLRDCTAVILDHVPHAAKRSRGATRKKDVVDVQWRLDKVNDFDRSALGYIQLTREKDRESWLPRHVGFSVGGTDNGFVMQRSEGAYELPGERVELQESAKAALEALSTFANGARYEEWRKSIQWKNDLLPGN